MSTVGIILKAHETAQRLCLTKDKGLFLVDGRRLIAPDRPAGFNDLHDLLVLCVKGLQHN
jgi:hypothetical protein